MTTGAPNVAWCHACSCDADFCWYALFAVCLSWITNGLLIVVIVLLLVLSSGINHRFVSASRGPSMMILFALITCTFFFLNTTVQSASHSTGTDINDLSISLNPCAFCASIGSSGASCSCRVVTEFIVLVLATPTLISSWCSASPRCLWLFDKNMLVAAESGWPCGVVWLVSSALNLFVRVDNRVVLSVLLLVTAAAYDICLLLIREDDVYIFKSVLFILF